MWLLTKLNIDPSANRSDESGRVIRSEEFHAIPHQLYPPDSPRHRCGFDPVGQHLWAGYVLQRNGEAVGRFALYDNPDLRYDEQAAAAIGSYECIDDPKAAQLLLEAAQTAARQLGKRHLIGPMEGSTWQAYRFGRHQQHRPFFSEPYHHLYYHEQFLANGFSEIAGYRSALDESPRFDEERFLRLEAHFRTRGIVLAMLNKEDLPAELQRIGKLSIEAFRQNFLYTPTSVEDFVKKYHPLVARLDPQFVWLAKNKATGELVGFLFAFPDLLDPTGRTLIIKSAARAGQFRLRGLGTYLTDRIYRTATELGYTRILHAFMRDDNDSIRISERLNGQTYNSYALYNCKL